MLQLSITYRPEQNIRHTEHCENILTWHEIVFLMKTCQSGPEYTALSLYGQVGVGGVPQLAIALRLHYISHLQRPYSIALYLFQLWVFMQIML